MKHFLLGGKLDTAKAKALKRDGADGFFLAAKKSDAEFFARRRGGNILSIKLTTKAQKILNEAGAITRKIPGGKSSRFDGDELFISSDLFEVFNKLIDNGDIKFIFP